VEPLGPPDVVAAARLLHYTAAPAAAVKRLVQGVLKSHGQSGERKSNAIRMSAELLLSNGEVSAARKLLQDNIVELTHQERADLLRYDTIVTVVSCVMLTEEISKLAGGAITVPTVDNIAQDPFAFSKCIRVLNAVRTVQGIANHKVRARKQECKLLLQDLKASFATSVAGVTVVHEAMTMEALYVAYLVGLEHISKASRYMANLRKMIPVTGDARSDSGVEQRYCQLLGAYLVRYRYEVPTPPVAYSVRGAFNPAPAASAASADGTVGLDSVAARTVDYSAATADAGYLRVANALLKQCEQCYRGAAPSLRYVHMLRVLYQTKLLPRDTYVGRLCDAIEVTGTAFTAHSAFGSHPSDHSASETDVVRYLLWKELSEVLGPLVQTVSVGDKLAESSDVVAYLTGSPLNHDAADSLHPALSSRGWWRSSVLSAHQLDGFVDQERLFEKATDPSAIESMLQSVLDIGATNTSADGEPAVDQSSAEQEETDTRTEDYYAEWLKQEREFNETLNKVFSQPQRKASIDADNESEDGADNGLNAGDEGGAGSGAEDISGGPVDASQMSNVSNDEAEYMSQESEAEVRGAAGGADGASGGAPQPAITARFMWDVLSIAVQGVQTERGGTVTVEPPLFTGDFAVRKIIQQIVTWKRLKPAALYEMGPKLLEMLVWQALVRAHMHTQDNIFTIRVVHVMFGQAVRNLDKGAAVEKKCLAVLAARGICVERALKLAKHVADRELDVGLPPAPRLGPQTVRSYSSQYVPVKSST
jgi:hypothetical protein